MRVKCCETRRWCGGGGLETLLTVSDDLLDILDEFERTGPPGGKPEKHHTGKKKWMNRVPSKPLPKDHKLPDVPLQPLATLDGKKIDEVRVFHLCQLLAKCLPLESAARGAGISVATISAWIDEGGKDFEAGRETPLAKFAQQVNKAIVDAEIDLLEKLVSNGPGNWQKYAWILERTRPNSYGQKKLQEHSIDVIGELGKLFAARESSLPKGSVVSVQYSSLPAPSDSEDGVA